MPPIPSNVKQLTTNARFLLLVICQLSIVLLLSACTAIGTNKPAALQITSTPEASVFLDGKHIGKTPYSSNQLKAREYLVKLSAGEATYAEKVSLREGTLTVINRELNNNFLAQSGEVLWLESGKSGLFISSMPAGADVVLDGTLIGQTPLLFKEVAEGDHKVTLTKAGYLQREFAIKTTGNYQLVADVTLASEIAKEGKLPAAPSPRPVAKVRVERTPQGFLRVRKEASLNSPEIGRVKTGDELEVLQETKDWVKIQFAGKQGWVASQYVKKI